MSKAWDERMSAAFETHSRSGTASSDVKQITHSMVTNMANCLHRVTQVVSLRTT